ncbi:hypothetical protein [Halorussus litoreus]|uniref:hypothetical protein n=1 Tax=Halorussus litoreus TaxID=1710536 RepID=UPI0013002380|nr:hypothetical protein [Halorussus litoreus]
MTTVITMAEIPILAVTIAVTVAFWIGLELGRTQEYVDGFRAGLAITEDEHDG